MTQRKNNDCLSSEKEVECLNSMNYQAREEFLRLVIADSKLNQAWKETLVYLVSEKIPDDMTPLRNLIDGVPDAPAQTIKN